MNAEVKTQDVLFVLYSFDSNKEMMRFIDLAYSTKGQIKQTFISSNRLKGYNLNQTR